MHLVRYIHLNPVHAKLVSHVKDWPFSNYLEWTENRQGSLVDHVFIQKWFDTRMDYQAFVKEYQEIRQDSLIAEYLLD